ncbi:MAG TPA: hypothetical protein VGX76_05310, partial [Pirellulales bacterium]|nr:hypothetical protein [Pirellulales bacterium]
SVLPSASTRVCFAIYEFSGAATSSPLDGTSPHGANSSALTTLSIPVAGSNELVIAIFGTTTGSAFAGFFPSGSITSTGYQNISGTSVGIGTDYNVSISVATAATASISSSTAYAAVGASFKPAAASTLYSLMHNAGFLELSGGLA